MCEQYSTAFLPSFPFITTLLKEGQNMETTQRSQPNEVTPTKPLPYIQYILLYLFLSHVTLTQHPSTDYLEGLAAMPLRGEHPWNVTEKHFSTSHLAPKKLPKFDSFKALPKTTINLCVTPTISSKENSFHTHLTLMGRHLSWTGSRKDLTWRPHKLCVSVHQ